MIKTADHLKVYLAVHSSPIQPHAQDSKRADVHFTCEGKTQQYSCHRLEGGQRILLSDEAAAFLIRSFQEGKKVTLSLPGYQSTVEGTAFTASFAKLEKPFPYPNLIHLPF